MRPASCVYWMTYLVLSLIAATLTTLQLRILRDVMEKLTAGIFRYAKKNKNNQPRSLYHCSFLFSRSSCLFCSGSVVYLVPLSWFTFDKQLFHTEQSVSACAPVSRGFLPCAFSPTVLVCISHFPFLQPSCQTNWNHSWLDKWKKYHVCLNWVWCHFKVKR